MTIFLNNCRVEQGLPHHTDQCTYTSVIHISMISTDIPHVQYMLYILCKSHSLWTSADYSQSCGMNTCIPICFVDLTLPCHNLQNAKIDSAILVWL